MSEGAPTRGANAVRGGSWAPHRFEAQLQEIADAASLHCQALLMLLLPARIGLPPAPQRAIGEANRIIAGVAAAHRAATVAPLGLQGWERLMPDLVHLTARGQPHLALLAAQQLAMQGFVLQTAELHVALAPLSDLARLRYALFGRLPAQLRDWRRRLIEGWGG